MASPIFYENTPCRPPEKHRLCIDEESLRMLFRDIAKLRHILSPGRTPTRRAQILGEEKQHVYRSVLVLCIAD
jgi:hypothetical protein